jgi:Uma2 family endonuclease
MSVESKLMTAEELWTLPNDDLRHELVRGELRTMSPTGMEHGGYEVRIAIALASHARAHQLGEVVGGEAGFRLSRDPDTVRAADVAFIRRERLPEDQLPRAYFEGPPDLVVEVVSPGDTAAEVEEKVQDWLTGGARAVWLVYSSGPRIAIHLPDGTSRTHGPEDEIDGADALPGFRIKVADLLKPLLQH